MKTDCAMSRASSDIAQHAQRQVVNRLLVLLDERGEGLRISRQALPDPRCVGVLTHYNYTSGAGKLVGQDARFGGHSSLASERATSLSRPGYDAVP